MRVGDVKAGAADDSVDRMLQAILGDDAIFLHLTNMLGDDGDVGLRYGWIEVVGEQDALAAHDVVGCEPGPEFGILDLLGQMLTGKLHAQLHFVGMVDQRIRRGFEAHIDSGADVELNQRQEAEEGALPTRDGKIVTRNDPGRSALEEGEMGDEGLDVWHELDG